MPKHHVSGGLLMYRIHDGNVEVLLAHPGGPFFKNKDEGMWTIPKGELEPDENFLEAAQREFREEVGFDPAGPFIALTPVKQKGGKIVHAWAFMGDLLYLPKDYETKESWPLVLFLHGSGERGDDLEKVKVHGPPKLIAEGKEFPFIVVSPQCLKSQSWEPIELTALLDEVIKNHKVDQDRIYVTGLSMGGFATWELAAFTPNRFAAIAPICGGGEPYWTKRFKHLPVWAFHGAKDKGVPVERTQEMIDALTKEGGTPKLTIYPEAEHDSWTEMYNNPEFYKWLLAQKRKQGE